MDLAQEPILESAQEYQDDDFLDMPDVSDPTYPLILLTFYPMVLQQMQPKLEDQQDAAGCHHTKVVQCL